MRPASDSVTVGTSNRLAEPVSRKRPGRRSRSTARLMAGSSAGTRCTSSTVAASGKAANETRGIQNGGLVVIVFVQAEESALWR